MKILSFFWRTVLKIPLWLLSVDDICLLLDVDDIRQISIIEKALNNLTKLKDFLKESFLVESKLLKEGVKLKKGVKELLTYLKDNIDKITRFLNITRAEFIKIFNKYFEKIIAVEL